MRMDASSMGGSPVTKITNGRAYVTSPHYEDIKFLVDQAMEYALRDDGTYFFETNQNVNVVQATVYDSGN